MSNKSPHAESSPESPVSALHADMFDFFEVSGHSLLLTVGSFLLTMGSFLLKVELLCLQSFGSICFAI